LGAVQGHSYEGPKGAGPEFSQQIHCRRQPADPLQKGPRELDREILLGPPCHSSSLEQIIPLKKIIRIKKIKK